MPDQYEVVVVVYRSSHTLSDLLQTLGDDVRVTVVDNSHGIDGTEAVVASHPSARWVDGPGTGYAAGANRGLAHTTSEIVVFAGPDSRPSQADLDRLVESLDGEPDLAAVCALYVDDAGRPEIGVGGWEPSVPRALVHAIGGHLLLPDAGLWARPVRGRPITVDWVGGSCTAYPRHHLVALGGFDESYFVYNEDVEFGRAAREAGLRSVLRTDIPVRHQAGTSGDVPRRMLQQRGASMVQYLRRHHPRWRVEGVRLALAAGTAARWLAARARRSPATAEGAAAYLCGLFRGAPA